VELGALEPLRDFCFTTDGVRGHLTVAAHGVAGDLYVYGQGKNISMADWSDLIIRTGVEHGHWPDDRHVVTNEKRLRPGVTDVMALRVGYEKLHRETGWEPKVSGAEGGGIGANRENPGRYWYANLMMGAHVLELARLHETAKVVIAGTVCAYPKFTPVPFSEDALWYGYPEETNAPYGVAKKSVLVGAQAYREQYGLDAIFLLPANLYGPRDNFDLETSHVIPALIRKMIESPEEVVLWGDGSPTREYRYV